MLGWRLFMRAVTLLTENLVAVLRISAVPYLLVVVATLYFQTSHGDTVAAIAAAEPAEAARLTQEAPGFLMATLVVNLVSLLGGIWIAVQWHRFVLLGEAPEGAVPPFHGRRLGSYLLWSVLVGLVVGLVVALAATMASVLLLPLFGPAAQPAVFAVVVFVGAVFFYRFGILLPARAVGKSMGFNDALIATKGHSGTCMSLAFLTAAFSLLLQIPPLLDGGTGPVSVVYSLVVQWIGLLLLTGTLTALYGHLVEGRPV